MMGLNKDPRYLLVTTIPTEVYYNLDPPESPSGSVLLVSFCALSSRKRLRKKAEGRFDAEMRAASAAPEGQMKSIVCGKSRRRRPMKVNPKALERQYGFVFNDDEFCVAGNQAEFQRLEQVREQVHVVSRILSKWRGRHPYDIQ